ncbi:hypothetical protein Pelo_1108 [Pelomyxa schiedti]|nr:hypothetical protein Pelo_1108 [Pelomyxa schiedti]
MSRSGQKRPPPTTSRPPAVAPVNAAPSASSSSRNTDPSVKRTTLRRGVAPALPTTSTAATASTTTSTSATATATATVTATSEAEEEEEEGEATAPPPKKGPGACECAPPRDKIECCCEAEYERLLGLNDNAAQKDISEIVVEHRSGKFTMEQFFMSCGLCGRAISLANETIELQPEICTLQGKLKYDGTAVTTTVNIYWWMFSYDEENIQVKVSARVRGPKNDTTEINITLCKPHTQYKDIWSDLLLWIRCSLKTNELVQSVDDVPLGQLSDKTGISELILKSHGRFLFRELLRMNHDPVGQWRKHSCIGALVTEEEQRDLVAKHCRSNAP